MRIWIRNLVILVFIAAIAAGVTLLWHTRPQHRVVYTDADAIDQPAETASLRDILWQPARRLDFFEELEGAGGETGRASDPFVSDDGTTLYFVHGRAGANADIYFSLRTSDGWSVPEALSAINTEADELGPALDRAGRTLYFHSNRSGGLGGYDLWAADRTADGWSEPRNLGTAINSGYDEYGAAIDPQGSQICFASNRPPDEPPAASDEKWSSEIRADAANRTFDLYRSRIASAENAATGAAIFLSAEPLTSLNTVHHEGAPAFTAAGDFLYFTSDRDGGHGGFDLYRSRILDDGYLLPTNLGDSINGLTNELDPAPGMGGFRLLFSSDRHDHSGDDSSAASNAPSEIYFSDSREVFVQTRTWRAAVDWAGVLRYAALIALAVVFLLLAWLLLRLLRAEESGRLGLLARCLIASVIAHLLLLVLFAFWGIGNSFSDWMNRGEGMRVALITSTSAGSGIAEQMRGALTSVEVSAADARAARQETNHDESAPDSARDVAIESAPIELSAHSPENMARSLDAAAAPSADAMLDSPEIARESLQVASTLESEPLDSNRAESPRSMAESLNAAAPLGPEARIAAQAAADEENAEAAAVALEAAPATPSELAAKPLADRAQAHDAAPSAQLPNALSPSVSSVAQASANAVEIEMPQSNREPAQSEGTATALHSREPAEIAKQHAQSGGMNLESDASASLAPAASSLSDAAEQSLAFMAVIDAAVTGGAMKQPMHAELPPAEPIATSGIGHTARQVATSELNSEPVPSRTQSSLRAALDPATGGVTAPPLPVAPPVDSAIEALQASSQSPLRAPSDASHHLLSTLPDVVVSSAQTGEPQLALPAAPSDSPTSDEPERHIASAIRGTAKSAIAPMLNHDQMPAAPQAVPLAADKPELSDSARFMEGARVQDVNTDALADADAAHAGDPLQLPMRALIEDLALPSEGDRTVAAANVSSTASEFDSRVQQARVVPDIAANPAAIMDPGVTRTTIDDHSTIEHDDSGDAPNTALSDSPIQAMIARANVESIEVELGLPPTNENPTPRSDRDDASDRLNSPDIASPRMAAQSPERMPLAQVVQLPANDRTTDGLDARTAALETNDELTDAATTAIPNEFRPVPAMLAAAFISPDLALPSTEIPHAQSSAAQKITQDPFRNPPNHQLDLSVHNLASAPMLDDPAIPLPTSEVSESRERTNAAHRMHPVDAALSPLELHLTSASPPAADVPGGLPLAFDPKLPSSAPTPPGPYAQRAPERRTELLEQLGGSADTELAVQRALDWLAAHQSADGRWDGDSYDENCGGCGDSARAEVDTAVTGLALLCFLAAEHTHVKEGPYQSNVSRAIDWLLAEFGRQGNLMGSESMYSHGIGAIALAEAYGMTGDERLEAPVRSAIRFIEAARNKSVGGWRYAPGQIGDTSVLGWQIMAMRSAQRSGIHVAPEALHAGSEWLDLVSTSRTPGRYAYQPRRAPSPAMTAEGMFVRQLLEDSPEEDVQRESAAYVLRHPPIWEAEANTYYWYYATLALFMQHEEPWEKWNEQIKVTLLANQVTAGKAAGSWPPSDQWSRVGGRVYQTAICTLTLEVYYRYLPRFMQ